jgi:hypothetical protein
MVPASKEFTDSLAQNLASAASELVQKMFRFLKLKQIETH